MHRYRAASLFQPTNLAGAIAQTMAPYSDTPYLYGSIMAFPHTMVARSVATLGMDFVMIDALHTSLDAENLTRLIHTINFCSEGKTVAVVRVPSASSHLLTHALDAGAGGIVFPHIDTAEQAADAVSRCRYASSGGERSLSPCALIPGITDIAPRGESHVTVADAHIAVICQIESPIALDNAAAIAATPGVASLMLGPGDLRLTLGLPPRRAPGVPAEPVFLEAIERLVRVSERFRKPLMTVSFKTTSEDAWIAKFNILLTTADFFNVVQGHQQDLKAVRGLIEKVCGSVVSEAGMGGEVKAQMNGIKSHGKQGLSNGFKAS